MNFLEVIKKTNSGRSVAFLSIDFEHEMMVRTRFCKEHHKFFLREEIFDFLHKKFSSNFIAEFF